MATQLCTFAAALLCTLSENLPLYTHTNQKKKLSWWFMIYDFVLLDAFIGIILRFWHLSTELHYKNEGDCKNAQYVLFNNRRNSIIMDLYRLESTAEFPDPLFMYLAWVLQDFPNSTFLPQVEKQSSNQACKVSNMHNGFIACITVRERA